MSAPLVIRPAVEADHPELRRAIVELQEYERLRHPTRLPGRQIADAYMDWMLRQAGASGAVLVAESDGSFVGFIAGWIEETENLAETPDSNRVGYVSDICVMPAFAALAGKQPVIPVDTKKKELVGDFKNGGREWRPKGDPEAVRVHDFLIKELGRAVPYGIYDIAANAGWVSVGMDNDTAAFAVQTIRHWWQEIGRIRYPEARCLTITADGGGGNGARLKLWKREPRRLATELGIEITVHHLPPGTSKWNKIEHRLFSFITQNWRAKPLVSYRVIVDLISATTTKTGLTVHRELDTGAYPKGIVVSDEELDAINITREEFHGEWNYTSHPGSQSDRAVDS